MQAIRVLPLSLIALTSCYNEEKYADDVNTATCEWMLACYPDRYETVDSCVSEATISEAGVGDGCVFHADLAKDCVAAWENLNCPENSGIPVFPDCSGVYTDCTTTEAPAE